MNRPRFFLLVSLTFALFLVQLTPLGFMVARPAFAHNLEFRLVIPAINVDLPVIKAPYNGETWDFSQVTDQAAYLEGRWLPGAGGNTVIGAHSELVRRKPGPFFRLKQIRVDDKIVVLFAGRRYLYRVERTWTVKAIDFSPILRAGGEVLTLLTCTGYDPRANIYRTRLVVRAVPIH